MANKNLRGITIEIGGDTTKLGKALEDSEKKSRSLQTELRQIQQSLKFNPDNVELLAQKQTVLTQSVEETSKKLDTLKEAEKQVIAQFERGEIAEEQVRALQREIIKTENQLESMSTELKDTSKKLTELSDSAKKAKKELSPEEIKEATDAYEELGNTASEAFDKIKVGVGVLAGATVAGAGYALNLSTEFDKAFNQMIAQTGATEDEFEDLNTAMENVYKNNFGESIDDVARSMAIVYNNTGLYGEELERTTEHALMLRDVFEFDINESTRSAKMLMDQFGLSAEQAYNFIANGATNGLDKNGDLLDTINEYAVHFKQLGLSADDMFLMLVHGADAGTFSVDKLGDAVKEFGVRAKDGSQTTIDSFTALGLDADEMAKKFGQGGESAKEALLQTAEALFSLEDPLAQNTAGVNLFGTMWEDLGVEGVKALMNMSGGAVDSVDALARINDIKYDDIGLALRGLGRTLQTDLVEPIGEELKPVVEDAIEYVQENGPAIKEVISNIVETVGKIVKTIVDNGPMILGIISAIGAGFLAWKAVTIIGAIIPVFTALISVIKGGTVAFKALNIVMKANIIGIIIGVIMALVSAFIYLWKNCEGFRNFWINLWEIIKNAIGVAVDWISTAFNKVVGFFKENWQSILTFIMNPFAGAFQYLYNNFEGFRNFVDGIVTSIKDFFVGIGTSISETFTNIWSYITTTVSNIYESVVNTLSDIWTRIVEIFTPAIEWFSALFQSIYDTLASIIEVIIVLATGCWEIIKTVFGIVATWFYENVIQPVKDAFTSLWNMISNLASSAWTGIKNIYVSVLTWFNKVVITPIRNAFTVVWNTIRNLATNAWTGIKNIWNAVSGWFSKTVITPISNFFSNMWAKLKTGASDAWTGIKNVFSGITTWFRTKFSEAWTAVKNIFSTGGKIFTGITEGITSAFKKVVNAIIGGLNKVIASPFNTINNVLDTLRGASIAGIKPFSKLPGISVPEIPLLYRGGILRRGQVGLLEGNGAEAVVPLEKETGWINRIAQKMNELQDVNPSAGNVALVSKMDEVIRTMRDLKSTIVLDTGVLVGETINQIDEQLGNNYSMRERRI